LEIRKVRGFQDIYGDNAKKYRFVVETGEMTDIVQKEMYIFEDRGGRRIALRPEGTASVVRAFIEERMYAKGGYHKLFYEGAMFRYERPQAGRYRQFHQIELRSLVSILPFQMPN